MSIDTSNKFIVGSQGNNIVIMNPPRSPISKQDALLLAAYLVAMSMASDSEFQAVLNAVMNA